MDAGVLALLAVSWTLMTFTLGAAITWRLEGRRPLLAPVWLVVMGNLAVISMAVLFVVAFDPPSRTFSVDPFFWNSLKAVILGGALVAFPLELRHTLRERRRTSP